MYNNPYMNNFNSQSNIDRINNQIAELEKMKTQMQNQQPANVTQNFQLSPITRDGMKYAGSIDEVEKDIVFGDTPFFSKDMSVVWIKNIKGDIRTYELKEIKPMDDKDIQIEYLQQQIEELKGRLDNEQYGTNDDEQFIETSSTENNGATRTTTKKSKSSSVSRVSKSKTK